MKKSKVASMKNIWVILISVVATIGVICAGMYLLQKNSRTDFVVRYLQNQTSPTSNQSSGGEFKEFKVVSAGMTATAEVPASWSMFQSPERIGSDTPTDLPTASIGQVDVAFGDMNWSQIDLYYVEKDVAASLIPAARDSSWSTEMIGGIEADVVTYPLDNGEVTKAGTGGKSYFLTLPSDYGIQTVVIWKQALGDEEFEKGFQRFIDTLKFAKN